MTEYIIIVALVAVAAIAVYQLFGQVVRSQTAAMAKELAGEDGSEQSRFAQSAAEAAAAQTAAKTRSEEHTSELQSLMRISYAVFCLKKKKQKTTRLRHITQKTSKTLQQASN